MGAWGTALFSDDLACDVRGVYREFLEDGVDDAEALSKTMTRFAGSLRNTDDEPIVVLALAVTASKVGRLTPELRDRALALLDAGRGAERWDDDPKDLKRRIAALAKVRTQLVSEQPARKKVRPPSRHVTSLQPGDVLALELREHDFIAIRVVRIVDTKTWVAPTVQVLDWRGDHLPTVDEIRDARDLAPRPMISSERTHPWWHTHGTYLANRGSDYFDLGFVKIGTIESRPGDEDRPAGGMGGWKLLARPMRTWTAKD